MRICAERIKSLFMISYAFCLLCDVCVCSSKSSTLHIIARPHTPTPTHTHTGASGAAMDGPGVVWQLELEKSGLRILKEGTGVADVHTCRKVTQTHAHAHACAHIRTHTRTHGRTDAFRKVTHTHKHTHTHANTQTHTHTHTHR